MEIPPEPSHGPKRMGQYIQCEVCGKVVYRSPSIVHRKRCSKKCANAYVSELYKNDEKRKAQLREVSKLVDVAERNKRGAITRRITIAEGRANMARGERNAAWRGGIATLQNTERAKPHYVAWRKAVYTRDNYTCQDCGTNCDLQAHHLKEFSKHPDLRYYVANGVTLCRTCHGNTHGRVLPDISKANRRKK